MKTNVRFFIISRSGFPRIQSVLYRTCTETRNTYFMFSYLFFPPEYRAVCAIVWKNIIQGGRPQRTIWRMRISCCIPKATNTLRLCNARCFSTTTVVTRTRLMVTLYVHCLSCFIYCVRMVCLFPRRSNASI